MEALKTVWTQLLKNFDKAPGWVPLLACVYLILGVYGIPAAVSLAGITLHLSVEFLAGLATLVFYQIGDAVDEWVFKTGSGETRGTRPRFKRRYEKEQERLQARLGVKIPGIYAIASKLADAAEKDRRTILVYGLNELAKCLRGLALPLILLGALTPSQGHLLLPIALTGIGVAAFIAYPGLKVQHVKRLYALASGLAEDSRLTYKDLDQVRLFFWNANFVASAQRIQTGALVAA